MIFMSGQNQRPWQSDDGAARSVSWVSVVNPAYRNVLDSLDVRERIHRVVSEERGLLPFL
jgi:hypothetical protein